jgi:predicted dehydrogenase
MIEGGSPHGSGAVLRYGMVGGGQSAFIGDVHRKAIAMDGKAELVAGCFSQSLETTLATGESWGVARDRMYASYEEMIAAEARRKTDRLDFILIVTPNDTHYAIARLALEKGFHVVCDKPLTTSSRDAQKLAALAARKDRLFCVTYAYRGYPVVFQMREMIAAGELGDIRFVAAEYPQDWLATLLEKTGQ